MKYFSYKVEINGTAFVSKADVEEMQKEIRANGGVAKPEAIAKMIIKERIEEMYPDDEIMKLNEVLFTDELKDPDVYLLNLSK